MSLIFERALDAVKKSVDDLIEGNEEDLERGWLNREDEDFTVNFKVKFLPTANGQDVKIETLLSFSPEKKIKKSISLVVSDQEEMFGDNND